MSLHKAILLASAFPMKENPNETHIWPTDKRLARGTERRDLLRRQVAILVLYPDRTYGVECAYDGRDLRPGRSAEVYRLYCRSRRRRAVLAGARTASVLRQRGQIARHRRRRAGFNLASLRRRAFLFPAVVSGPSVDAAHGRGEIPPGSGRLQRAGRSDLGRQRQDHGRGRADSRDREADRTPAQRHGLLVETERRKTGALRPQG